MKSAILTSNLLGPAAAIVTTVLLWQAVPAAQAGGGPLCGSSETVRAIISENPETAKTSATTLRAFGQLGVDAIFAVYGKEIAAMKEDYLVGKPLTEAQQRLRTALDTVAQQHNAFTSQLYWHTDLEAAKAAASATGKPILSLRLLGKLTDEYSCANSRFFRTILYANDNVSKQLRENYVLHWESVRPVPKVTIDFGDGRVLERTLTGNSIHYVLDAQGRAIDGIPGLYGPGAFIAATEAAREVEKTLRDKADVERSAALREYHTQAMAKTLDRWAGELQENGVNVPPKSNDTSLPARRKALEAMTDEAQWLNLATKRLSESRMGGLTRRMMALQQANFPLPLHRLASPSSARYEKLPSAEEAGQRAIGKMRVEDPLLRMTRKMEHSIGDDTARNEYLLHTELHEWFAAGSAPTSLAELNERVYTRLFLTPSSDPWLGLAPAETYSALERDGRSEPLIGRAKQP